MFSRPEINFQFLPQPIPLAKQDWPEGVRPLVSILCTAYNHRNFIEQCLKGFLAQETTFPVEILIHDDASIDGTAEIIKAYENAHPNLISAIYQTENQWSKGVKVSRVYNLPRAKGYYIALCEGDDYWMSPEKLQRQVDYLENHFESVACFCNSSVIDEYGNVLREERIPGECQRRIRQVDIISGFCPPTNTMVFRRSNLDPLPKISKKVVNLDFITNALLSEHGTIDFLPGIMAAYRIHDGGIWSSRPPEYHLLNNLRTRSALLVIYKEKYRDVLLPDIETYYLKLISSYIDQGKVLSFIYITLSKFTFNYKQRLGNSLDDFVVFFKRFKRVLRNWAFKI